MSWLQIAFACTPDQAPTLSDLLTEAGAVAVTFVDAGDEPKYQPSTEPTDFWSQTIVTGMFQEGTEPSEIIGFLGNHLETCPEYTIALLEDEDWERSWMDRFQPMKFGDNLWICPSWHEPVDSSATNIFVDPGLAFGTGTHASTAMCLEWLDNHPPIGQEIVDYGCGSGVLAIAALKLGAAVAWATDIDPQALLVTRENAEKNGVTEQLHVCYPDDLAPGFSAHLVLANILAEPLITLAPRLTALVKPGGHLVLSGFLEDQTSTVKKAYEPHFSFTEKHQQGWVLLAGLKIAQD